MTSPPPDAGSASCVRHPDRPTGLRCVRCERPACPECLREAAVGYQCVDCVREGSRTARRAVTPAGAEVNTKPLVVPVLIALNLAVYLLNVIQSGSLRDNNESLSFDYGVLWPVVAASGEWWRLFTSGFLHIGPIHLLLNMASLWIVGRDLEVLFGRVRFLVLYLVSMLGGSTAVFLLSESPTAGASGAVFGLMGALAVAVFRLKLPVAPALAVIALNLVFSFSSLINRPSGPETVPLLNISWEAHVGGLVVGALLAIGFLYPPARIRKKAQIATVVGVVVLLTALLVVRDAYFTQDIECFYDTRMQCYIIGTST